MHFDQDLKNEISLLQGLEGGEWPEYIEDFEKLKINIEELKQKEALKQEEAVVDFKGSGNLRDDGQFENQYDHSIHGNTLETGWEERDRISDGRANTQ